MENNLFIILEQMMKQAHFHCEWGIEWLENQNYFEIICQFKLPNPQESKFINESHIMIDHDLVPYQYRTLFHNSQLLLKDYQTYLKIIEIDGQEGIAMGELQCIIKYLKKLSTQVRLLWLDFQESASTEFKVDWDDEEFEQLRRSMIENRRYNPVKVFLPLNQGFY